MRTFLLLMVLSCLAGLHSCKKEDVVPFELVSIVANGVDLNGSSRPTGVAVNAVIMASFTADIDPGSLLAGSVTMIRDYDTAHIVLSLIISKKTLAIKSTADLVSGASYTLVITSSVRSSQGQSFRSFSRTFKTIGTFVPADQKAYWNFDDSPNDVLGTHDPVTYTDAIVSYVDGKNAASGKAALFDGKTSIIQVPGGSSLLGPEFTITFWMFLNNENPKGSYVLGIGNYHGLEFEVEPNYAWCRFSHGLLLKNQTTTTSDFQYYANGRTRDDLETEPDSIKRGIDNATTDNKDLGPDGLKSKLDKVWAQIAFTFDDSTKTRSLFINGELMYRQNLDLIFLDSMKVLPALWPLGRAISLKYIPDATGTNIYKDDIVFGFWQNKDAVFGSQEGIYGNINAKHFQGKLDDVRIFSRALSDLEISYIYSDEKP